jgi:PncC family amidohydrolase
MQEQSQTLEYQAGVLLRNKGWTLAIAESCTGGLIGDLITNVTGSTDYFVGGVIAYANSVKENLLGVQHETLVQFGAVSSETAKEMANGIRTALGADIGISVTGIAGPGGGTPVKPIGLVWIGISTASGDQAYRYLFIGNRNENKRLSADQALKLLIENLNGAQALR